MTDIQVYPDAEELIQAAATHIRQIAQAAIAERGRFSISLSGGSTPRSLYALLAREPFASAIDWPLVYCFWGDERYVPPDHPDSNYHMAHKAMLRHLPIPRENIYRIPTELDQTAAQVYEAELRHFFTDQSDFDLVLLGMGDDGHTASLFPGHGAVYNRPGAWVAAYHVDKLDAWRITLTPAAINAARNIIFLVTGENKAERLRQVLHGPHQPDQLPVQLIQPANGSLRWLVDAAAASRLP